MRFREGERVRLKQTHEAWGTSYDSEAQVGDVGIVQEDEVRSSTDLRGAVVDAYNVTWENGVNSNVNAYCLESVEPEPSTEELAEVYRSLGVLEPRGGEGNAVAAFLQGMLAAECQSYVRDPRGLKVRAVDQGVDEQGNYQSYFTVTTESGIRLRVQITPEEGA